MAPQQARGGLIGTGADGGDASTTPGGASSPTPRGLLATLARVPAVIVGAVGRYLTARGSQHAAGIAYRVLFSLAPLAIVLLAVFGLILQDDDVRARVVDAVIGALPLDASGRDNVERAIDALASPASVAGLISLVAFLWAASGMMGAIRGGLEAMMGLTPGRRPLVRGKLVDLALVAGTAVVVLASVAFGLVTESVTRVIGSLGGAGTLVGTILAVVFPFLLSVGTALMLYRFVPAARLPVRDALAGALVTAVMLSAISYGSSLVYGNTTEWSLIFGSLATLLVFLYSVYLYASALLLGAAIATELGQPPSDAPAEPLALRLRKAIRGLVFRERPDDTSS